jgi:hypothetical protein
MFACYEIVDECALFNPLVRLEVITARVLKSRPSAQTHSQRRALSSHFSCTFTMYYVHGHIFKQQHIVYIVIHPGLESLCIPLVMITFIIGFPLLMLDAVESKY